MSRFFFHVIDEDFWTEDAEGRELAHAKAALVEARTLARDLTAAMIQKRKPVEDRKILVVNDHGILVHELYFRDMVKELGG